MVNQGGWRDSRNTPENVPFSSLPKSYKISTIIDIFIISFLPLLGFFGAYKYYNKEVIASWIFLILGLIALFFIILGIILKKWNSFTVVGTMVKKQ